MPKLTETQREKIESIVSGGWGSDYLVDVENTRLNEDCTYEADRVSYRGSKWYYLPNGFGDASLRLINKMIKCGYMTLDEENRAYFLTDLFFSEFHGIKRQLGNKTCPRCFGKGYIREFSHIDGGRCWECNK